MAGAGEAAGSRIEQALYIRPQCVGGQRRANRVNTHLGRFGDDIDVVARPALHRVGTGTGNDTLIGGAGNDTLIGGAGS
ncbi:hypothetical protein ACC685_37385, partial [Rhizobium ruizarguesonis]